MSRAAFLAVSACLTACAANPFSAYKSAHPDWFSTLPATDVPLDETLASIYAPSTAGYQLVVSKLQVFRTDGGAWQELSVDDLVTGKVETSDQQDYAVAALIWCHSEVDLERYTGERASWYLLPKNRVTAYDHYDFTERCVVANDYRPATGALVPSETQLNAVASKMTRMPVHSAQLYRKGVALVKVGRLDDARAMLKAGDTTSAHGAVSGGPRFDPGRAVEVGDLSDDAKARQELVKALQDIDVAPTTPPVGAARR